MFYDFNKTDLLPEVDARIDQMIKGFSTHDLSAISNSGLMNRVDSKFLLPINSIYQVLNSCSLYYSVLMIDKVTIFQYNNIYFDTRISVSTATPQSQAQSSQGATSPLCRCWHQLFRG